MDTEQPETPEASEDFGRGYFLFFGALGGFFIVVALALTVLIGYPLFVDDAGAPTATTAPEPGNGDGAAGDPIAGEEIFVATCAPCHGPTAEGVPGLGPSLIGNEFVNGLSDDELLAFLNEGRAADAPDNTTGVAMPPKGGNPSLTDDDLMDVIAFLRELG